LNYYAFCNDNPISLEDPFGLCVQEQNAGPNRVSTYLDPVLNDINSRYRYDLPAGIGLLYNADEPIFPTLRDTKRARTSKIPRVTRGNRMVKIYHRLRPYHGGKPILWLGSDHSNGPRRSGEFEDYGRAMAEEERIA
jgi:hypothetical protein